MMSSVQAVSGWHPSIGQLKSPVHETVVGLVLLVSFYIATAADCWVAANDVKIFYFLVFLTLDICNKSLFINVISVTMTELVKNVTPSSSN